MQCKVKDDLCGRLESKEGETDLYRLVRQRDRDGENMQQTRVIKDRGGHLWTGARSVMMRWKEYFEELTNEENKREGRVEEVNIVDQSGKAVGPDETPVEVWKCLGELAVESLPRTFSKILESERMPEESRRNVLVSISNNKRDVQSCGNYRGIKLMSHKMKLWKNSRS